MLGFSNVLLNGRIKKSNISMSCDEREWLRFFFNLLSVLCCMVQWYRVLFYVLQCSNFNLPTQKKVWAESQYYI